MTSSSEFDFEQLSAPEPELVIEASSIQDVYNQAREDGLADGRAVGHAEAIADASAALSSLHTAVAAVHGEAARIADELEREAVDLALKIAEQVLVGTLDVQPERVVDAVRGALRSLIDRERVHVLVNPDDLELVTEASAGLAGELGGIERLEIQAERRVERGGAIVRTADGEIDATHAAKLETVRSVVAAELAS